MGKQEINHIGAFTCWSSQNIAVVAVMSSNVKLMYFPPQFPLVMVSVCMPKWSAGYTCLYAYHSRAL